MIKNSHEFSGKFHFTSYLGIPPKKRKRKRKRKRKKRKSKRKTQRKREEELGNTP